MKVIKIFRIDGNLIGNEPSKGVGGYYSTKEKAEQKLLKDGYCLEKRKWKDVVGHEPETSNRFWYSRELSNEGFHYDDTNYAFITEVKVI